MRRAPSILGACVAALLALPAFAANDALIEPPAISCGNGVPGGINCTPSKQDFKQARNAYKRGLKLEEHKKIEQAFPAFDQAARLMPRDPQNSFRARSGEVTTGISHTERGDALLANAQREPAAAEFRAALDLDPDNDYMQGRLAQAQHKKTSRSTLDFPCFWRSPAKSFCDRKPKSQAFTIAATPAASSLKLPQSTA